LNGTTNINLSEYADIKASMDAIYSGASAMNESATLADNTDVTQPFFKVFQLMRDTIDKVI